MIFKKRRFTIKELQQLIMDGWEVTGDCKFASRNSVFLTPAIYREQQVKRSELRKEPKRKPMPVQKLKLLFGLPKK